MRDPLLLIFDIDGTLTDSGGLTRVALEQAAEELYGVTGATKGIAPWGQTDLNIFQEMISNTGLPVKDVEREFISFSERYARHFEQALFSSDKPRLHIGVGELLDRLSSESDVSLALGTGNLQTTGRMKLKRHSVDHHFPVGGFGSDSSDRPTLLKLALTRARRHYGQAFPTGSYWVVGDTPNDIISGKRIAAETVAVCTGHYGPDELARHRPTAILPDLSNPDYFLAVIRREIESTDGQVQLFG